MSQHTDTAAALAEAQETARASLGKLAAAARARNEELQQKRKGLEAQRRNTVIGASLALDGINREDDVLKDEMDQLAGPLAAMDTPTKDEDEDDSDGTQPPADAPAPVDTTTSVEVPPAKQDAPIGFARKVFVIEGEEIVALVPETQPDQEHMLQSVPVVFRGETYHPVILEANGPLLVFVTIEVVHRLQLEPVLVTAPVVVHAPTRVDDTPAPAPESRSNPVNPANWGNSLFIWVLAIVGAIVGVSIGWNWAPMDGFLHFVWTLGFGCVGFFGLGGIAFWLENHSKTNSKGRKH